MHNCATVRDDVASPEMREILRKLFGDLDAVKAAQYGA